MWQQVNSENQKPKNPLSISLSSPFSSPRRWLQETKTEFRLWWIRLRQSRSKLRDLFFVSCCYLLVGVLVYVITSGSLLEQFRYINLSLLLSFVRYYIRKLDLTLHFSKTINIGTGFLLLLVYLIKQFFENFKKPKVSSFD